MIDDSLAAQRSARRNPRMREVHVERLNARQPACHRQGLTRRTLVSFTSPGFERFDTELTVRRSLCRPGVVIMSVLLGTRALSQAPAASAPLALVGGSIYSSPTEPPIRDGAVLIDGGKIVSVGRRTSVRVPRGTTVIDTTGATITAGFWNSHVHFLERMWADPATVPASVLTRQFQMMLTQYGFTSVFDIWSSWENTRQLRDRVESGDVAGPRIRATGPAMFPRAPGASAQMELSSAAGWASMGFMPQEKIQLSRVAERAEAVARAKQLLDLGADGIKLYVASAGRNGPSMSENLIQSVVQEAHGRGKPVFVHPTTTEGLMASVRAGVDVLAHTTPQSGPWNESVLAAMSQARVALIPTLSFWRYQMRHDRISAADAVEESAVEQLRSWVAAGGTVLYGTDLGWVTIYDPTVEYLLLAKAMTFPQILASLTTAPAGRFGDSARLGRIAPGLIADLTVIRADPTKDIRALSVIDYTIRDGKVIYRGPR
jgi:imidazolonepropionase-like amidohydrolase